MAPLISIASHAFANDVTHASPPSDNWIEAVVHFFQNVFIHVKSGLSSTWEVVKQHSGQVHDRALIIWQAVEHFVWITCVTNHPFWTSFGLFFFALGPMLTTIIIATMFLVVFLVQSLLVMLLAMVMCIIGFTAGGVRQSSMASQYQSRNYGAVTPARGPFAGAQSFAQAPPPPYSGHQVYSAAGGGWFIGVLRVLAFVAGVLVLKKGLDQY